MRNHSATPFSRSHQQLILGPWDHSSTGRSKVGELDFGATAQLDVVAENLIWFDRFLKKSRVTEDPFPVVRYFSMGDNVWHTAPDWPPREAKLASFYLHSNGHAQTRKGDGRLDANVPNSAEPRDEFKADPGKPVPAVPATGEKYLATWGPVDQRLAQDRSDVLMYSTAPLSRPLTFAGPLRAELYVSANSADADWVVRLVDVYPDGRAYPLATGIQRGSFRDSDVTLSPLAPGEKYLLAVDLGHAAAKLDQGHSLAIQIAGTCFPLFDRNTNTGEGPTGYRTVVSHEDVWHTRAHPSRILLPLMD